MSKNLDGSRRSSIEERRVFRTARIEFVEIGRIAGIDAAAAELMREADIAPPRLLNFEDWSTIGLETLMLSRLPIVVGCPQGTGTMGWLANPGVLLAAQQHWRGDTRIPVVVVAHQLAERTRRQIAGGGIFADSSPALTQSISPGGQYRVWMAMIDAGLNPLGSTAKMNLVRASGCDPRKLPAVRTPRPTQESSQ